MPKQAAIGFAAYTITLKQVRQDTFFSLDGLNDGNDLLELFKDYLDNLAGFEDDEENSKLFRTVRVNEQDRYLTGVIESGEYGIEQSIFNRRTKRQSGSLTRDDSSLLPFYFLFYLPAGKTEGIALLQTFKQFGVQSILMGYLRRSLKEAFPHIVIVSEAISNTDLINMLVRNSKVLEVSFSQRKLPDDIADEVYRGIDSQQRNVGRITLSIRAGYNSTIPLKRELMEMFSGNLTPNEILRLDIPFEPEIATVKLNLNGRYRTVSYGAGIDLTPVYDVTDKITVGANGKPVYESLDQAAKELLTDLLEHDDEGKAQ